MKNSQKRGNGRVKRPCILERLRRLWAKASRSEKEAFLTEVGRLTPEQVLDVLGATKEAIQTATKDLLASLPPEKRIEIVRAAEAKQIARAQAGEASRAKKRQSKT